MKNIICERRTYESKFNKHAHFYGQLILPIRGKLYIETSSKTSEVNDKQLFFLPPECSHIFRSDESNEFLTLDINKQVLAENDMESVQGGKEIDFNDKWKAIRYLMLNESAKCSSSSAINDLFNYCYHFILEDSEPKSIAYLKQHFAENVDLKTLSDLEHYNAGYYSEWFKNKMNMTVTDYIKNLRINKAKEYLRDTDLSILEIAQMTGYEHNSSFTRVFKEREMISPAQYRKRL